jgi:stage III sporulation protein AG
LKVENHVQKLKKLLGTRSGIFVLIGLLAGIFLLLLPTEKAEEAIVTRGERLTSEEYCEKLESKAAELIEKLPEVDSCSVFITLETGYRYIYATDQHVHEQSESKQIDKTIVIADSDSGESPILVEEAMPKIAGVAVVCEGASYETQRRIIDLICALFDIKSNRISVQT